MRIFAIVLFLIALLWEGQVHANPAAMPRGRTIAEFPAKFPYRAFDVTDELGREIQFYLTDAEAKDDRPLIVVLQGSGCASQFLLQGGQVAGGWFAFVRRAAKERAQVLLIDKPGVKLFDAPANPGGGSDCSEAFRKEHTGERWLTAIKAALSGVHSLRGVAPRATLVLGHSEGAVMALRLPLVSQGVTHVAALAGVPASQLHDFVDMADRSAGLFAGAPGGREQHLGHLLDTWDAIRKDPQSDTKLAYGHAHRYWSDKFAPVDINRIAGSGARIFLAYGDRDDNSAPRTMDQFAIELLIRKTDLTWIRVPGADHGFAVKNGPAGGMQTIIERAVAWFLGDTYDASNQLWPRSGRA